MEGRNRCDTNKGCKQGESEMSLEDGEGPGHKGAHVRAQDLTCPQGHHVSIEVF